MRSLARPGLFVACLLMFGASAINCGDDSATGAAAGGDGGEGGGGGKKPAGPAELVFDLGADLTSTKHFYDQPYPSDSRLNAAGGPDLRGFPLPDGYSVVVGLREAAMQRLGYPVVPVAYFQFTGPLAAQDPDATIAADVKSQVLLVDVDAASDERGAMFPTVASTLQADGYVPSNVLAVAARPGIILKPHRTYAFVVLKGLGDAKGDPLAVDRTMQALAAGTSGGALQKLYDPLFATLDSLHVKREDVVAANVFTTADVVKELADLSTALVAKYDVTIDDLHVDPDDGATHPRYCELKGTVTMPQFQKGTPPFDTQGLFDFSDGGLPAKQRDEVTPITITLPDGDMPEAGFPLVQYFHGSGGLSTAVVDRGTWVVSDDAASCPEGTLEDWMGTKGCNTKGEGPAFVLAPFGFAMAGGALPVNPERLPGASETAYLNINNLAEGRDLFRQGIIEQRLFLEALSKIQIDPAVFAACTNVVVPAGEKAHFDMSHVYAQGQSMGGQYTNLFSAVEPKVLGAVPTGAGGYWSHFVLHTPLQGGALAGAVGVVLLGTTAKLSFLHPGMFLFETVWEPVDPVVYMPRLAARPLDGHAPRPIYEPVGLGDSYFPTVTYDAMVLAYRQKEAGDQIWPTMQDALSLEGLGGILPYPVTQDLTSSDGSPYTGVVIQYAGDGVYDPHALYSQLDSVKYQYGCFLSTLKDRGVATVPAPATLGTACP